MTDVQVRRARAEDEAAIRQMVKEARLDPSSLNWPQFLVAEKDGAVVGIGQIRPYPNCRELGSLVVKKAYQERGIGGRLVEALLENETGDVYLECVRPRDRYYAKFGFERISVWQTPMAP